MTDNEKKLVPKNQTLWASYYDKEHNLKGFVTSDQARTKYFFYEVKNGVATKKETAKMPTQFASPSKK